MKRRPLAVVVGLGLIALAGLVALRPWHRPPPPGPPAPGIELEDTLGRKVSLEALRGRVVAVNFWASWCAPCLQEIPDLVRLYAERGERCFELLGVAEDSALEDVLDVGRRLQINYPLLVDDGGEVGEAYRVTAYPRTYLIDAKGYVREVFRGIVERAALERALEPLLSETKGSCPSV